jgi:uncharacterized DUF497 family protein
MRREVRIEVEGFVFTWDAQKAASNPGKHGISFEEALEVVFDAYYRAEDAGVEDEDRYGVIGYSHRNRLLYVVLADAGETGYRIVSARPATPRERERYEEDNPA